MNVDLKMEQVSESQSVVKTEKSSYTVSSDRVYGFWTVGVSTGTVPVALRGKYTTKGAAAVAIKNYLDGHKERSAIYSNKKKDD